MHGKRPCFILPKRQEREDFTMNKIDWKRKLTSRKFWLSIASFVSMLMVALGQPESTVIGYVIGEGLADSGNQKSEEGE